MPAPVLTTAATIMCPHGGQAVLITTNTKLMVGGMPALTLADVHAIAGCPFFIGPKPSPCVRIQWISGSTVVSVDGVPVLTQASVGLCLSPEQAPQGPPVVVNPGQIIVLAK
jgi:uncharacterized Zn-binding protein involved in type VI secretion